MGRNALINGTCGISYRPDTSHVGNIGVNTTRFSDLTVGMLEFSGHERSIAAGFKFNDASLSGQTVTIGRIYADFFRSLAAGIPIALNFAASSAKTPSYVKDYTGAVILDNSDGKYNGHSVVIQCVDNYSVDGAHIYKWSVAVEDDDIVKVRQALGGKQDAISDLAAIRSNASAGAAKVSCTDATVGGFGYTKVTDNHINSLIDAKLGVIENGSY